MKRAFLIILDSFGIGGAKDAADFDDAGSNTLAAICKSEKFNVPTLEKMGLFNIDGVTCGKKIAQPTACFARMAEVSMGKDTTIGHWEIAGIESEKALPVFKNGFPQDVINEFSKKTGHKILCNMPYSGTQVIADYGQQQIDENALIVYTSADSVFQIAAHEDSIPVNKLYEYCQIARDMLIDDLGVGRVIARPFTGTKETGFIRTSNRHDFSIVPPKDTVLDYLQKSGYETIGVGKIFDIFAGKGISKKIKSTNNIEGMDITISLAKADFSGLAFVNLVDFDMLYGHRNNIDGYAAAATQFDKQLAKLLPTLREDDIIIITADHGCDPSTPSTDHSRENVPMLIYGSKIKKGVNLGTLNSFANMGATIAQYFNVDAKICGKSFLDKVLK